MRKIYGVSILILGVLLLGMSSVSALDGEIAAEFAYLSGISSQAMEYAPHELEALVKRCNRLHEQTASLQTSEKKVMRKRIERLRKLFLYVLSSKSVTKQGRSDN